MKGFIYGVFLQWKIDFRNKGILITYYIVPLVFFAFMSAIFSSIDPNAKNTLIQSMTIFGVTMGAFLGAPIPLVDLYGSEIKKAYRVGGIPLWIPVINNFISAFIHLMIISLFIFFVSPIVFEAKVPESLGIYFGSLVIFIIVSLGVGTALGLWIKSSSKITMASQFIFLPSIMLSGIMFSTNLLPETIAVIGKILPATWGLQTMTARALDFKLFIPMIAILIVCIGLSIFKLLKIVSD